MRIEHFRKSAVIKSVKKVKRAHRVLIVEEAEEDLLLMSYVSLPAARMELDKVNLRSRAIGANYFNLNSLSEEEAYRQFRFRP